MDPTLFRRARQAIDFLANRGLLRDQELDPLRECLRWVEQGDDLAARPSPSSWPGTRRARPWA
jgi:hypothetical protein